MSKELSVQELALEGAELLPSREALGGIFSPNLSQVWATASATAVNAVTIGSLASANAANVVTVVQS